MGYVIEGLSEDELRLSSHQKAMLLPWRSTGASFVKPGILALNAVRNHFGHNVYASISRQHLQTFDEPLSLFMPGAKFPSDMEKVESFAMVACFCLAKPPQGIGPLLEGAFSHVHVRADSPKGKKSQKVKRIP